MVSAFDRVRNPQKIQEGRCSKFITEGFRTCWPIRALIGVFPPNKSAELSARSCVTSQVHEGFLRFFLPEKGIVSIFFSFVGRQLIS